MRDRTRANNFIIGLIIALVKEFDDKDISDEGIKDDIAFIFSKDKREPKKDSYAYKILAVHYKDNLKISKTINKYMK